jgi:hypothetical protein
MSKTYLPIGGVVAAGFDCTGKYLLVISHSGRGVFSTETWERVARDIAPAYTEQNCGIGIGPIEGQAIPITEMDHTTERFCLTSLDDKIQLNCESSGIAVRTIDV